MHDAPAKRGDGAPRTSVEEILEAMPNIGDVTVNRVGPDAQGGYAWSVTFDAAAGDVPQLYLAQSALQSIGADVSIGTVQDGSIIGGYFRLSYEGDQTDPIPTDATENDIRIAMQALSTVGTISVRSVPPPELAPQFPAEFGSQSSAAVAGLEGPIGERAWAITFTSDSNSGVLSDIVPSSELMLGDGAQVLLCTGGSTAYPCAGLSSRGNFISGSLSLEWGGANATVPFDATATSMKSALEQKLGTGSVTVDRTGPDRNGGFTWTIAFDQLQGNVDEIQVSSNLNGTDAMASLVETHQGTVQEVQ